MAICKKAKEPEKGKDSMTKETYLKITDKLRENPKREKLIRLGDKILTGLVYLVYPLYLVQVFLNEKTFLLRAILVPAISFAAVSLFRTIYNAPRPYEKFGVPPVLKKDTKGKSFPSRHVFSVFVIAVTVFYLYPAAGAVLGVVGAVLGTLRVLGGVHEPRDVAAGALVGMLSGILGYYII